MKKKKSTKKKPISRRPKRVGTSTKASGNKAKNSIGMMPLGDRVLVKPAAQETTTAFGIIIPESAKEKPETGVVVAVGQGKKADNGAIVAMSVKVGDKVMFSKYGFDEVKVAGVEYYLISESNILAILN